MTINAFNGAFTSVLNRDNRLQNIGQQTQPRNLNVQPQGVQAGVQTPAPTQLAEQVVTQINQSQNLSAGFKRDAIALAAG